MAKKKQNRWGAFQNKTIRYVLPVAGVEVTLKEPDVLGIVITGGLPDAFFNMFSETTKEGLPDNELLQQLGENPEVGEGFRKFIDMIVIEAFIEPRLVRNESEADFESTVPLGSISFVDKLSVIQSLNIMGGLQQLGSLDQFRTAQNGTVAAAPQGEEL